MHRYATCLLVCVAAVRLRAATDSVILTESLRVIARTYCFTERCCCLCRYMLYMLRVVHTAREHARIRCNRTHRKQRRRSYNTRGTVHSVNVALLSSWITYMHSYIFYFSNPEHTHKISTYKNNNRTLVLWLHEGHDAS